eukprot:6183313-Pleurochrysis_carterae.AAC.1
MAAPRSRDLWAWGRGRARVCAARAPVCVARAALRECATCAAARRQFLIVRRQFLGVRRQFLGVRRQFLGVRVGGVLYLHSRHSPPTRRSWSPRRSCRRLRDERHDGEEASGCEMHRALVMRGACVCGSYE